MTTSIENPLHPFTPLSMREREILYKIERVYEQIYSAEIFGQPAVRQGGLPAVARYIAELLP